LAGAVAYQYSANSFVSAERRAKHRRRHGACAISRISDSATPAAAVHYPVVQCHYSLAQLRSCLDVWDVELIQLGPAQLGGDAISVSLPSMGVIRLLAGRSVLVRGTASATRDCLMLTSSRSSPVRLLGQPIDAQRFAVTGKGARIDLFLPADATLCIIEAGLIAGAPAKRIQLRSTRADCMEALQTMACSIVDTDNAYGACEDPRLIDDSLAQQIRRTMQMSEVLACEASVRSLRAWAVDRACRYIDARLAQPLSLAALARHCGVGIRTLEYSFRQFYDTTPISFIKSQRLTQTHLALAQAPGQAKISKIAKRSGFTHMGQYCQDYRALFGESPSMTLQHALRSENAPVARSSAPPPA
jgi:AraC-like DNA-binding protein